MNTWQALKKIVRDQFFHPVPRGHVIVWKIGNIAHKSLFSEEFETEQAAWNRIKEYRDRGENVLFLEVFFMGKAL